jgi:hypothetical protein
MVSVGQHKRRSERNKRKGTRRQDKTRQVKAILEKETVTQELKQTRHDKKSNVQQQTSQDNPTQ